MVLICQWVERRWSVFILNRRLNKGHDRIQPWGVYCKQNFVGNSLLPPLPFPPHHNPQSGFSVLTNVTLVHNHSWPALPQKYTGFKFLGYTVISTIKTWNNRNNFCFLTYHTWRSGPWINHKVTNLKYLLSVVICLKLTQQQQGNNSYVWSFS